VQAAARVDHPLTGRLDRFGRLDRRLAA